MAEEYPGGLFPGDYPEGPEPIRTYGQRYKWDGDHYIRMEQEALKVGPTGPAGPTGPTGPVSHDYAPGVILMYAGSTLPGEVDEWLFCNGQTLNSVTHPQYAALYNVIRFLYGGSGPTNFQLPNLTARFPVGQSGIGSVISNAARASGNTYTHSLTGGSHTHGVPYANYAGGNEGWNYANGSLGSTGNHSHNVAINRHDGHGMGVGGTGFNGSGNGGLANFVGIHEASHGHNAAINSSNYSGGATNNVTSGNFDHGHNYNAIDIRTTSGNATNAFAAHTSSASTHNHTATLPVSTLFYIIKT